MDSSELIGWSLVVAVLLIWLFLLALTILPILSIVKKARRKDNFNFFGMPIVHTQRPISYYALAVFLIFTSFIPIALFIRFVLPLLAFLGASGV
jgi:hypothetical protein